MNIPFSRVTLGEEEKRAVCDVLDSGWLAAGEQVSKFEDEFSNYISPKGENYYCIFTSSCTSALKMAYKCARELYPDGFKPIKDRPDYGTYTTAVYPRNTFCATYSAAAESGLRIRTYDDFEQYDFLKYDNIPNDIFNYAVHFRVNVHYGSAKDETPCLIEDSAHRIEPNDPLVGKIRCYSFYATKNMTTGSGGMFVTNDKEIYEKARLYWKDGLSTSTFERQMGKIFYEVASMAGGYDGNDIGAAIGRIQLQKLPGFTKRRNEIVRRYNESFGQTWGGNHLYPYFVRDEQEVKRFIEFMDSKGIKCGYHYPNTGWLGVSLPLYPLLTDSEVSHIIESIKEYEKTRLSA